MRSIAIALQDLCGQPARMAAVLKERDGSPVITPLPRTASRSSVAPWHRLRFPSTWETAPPALVAQQVTQEWHCDIRAVDALSNSKSPVHEYATLDDFAQACCRDKIQNATVAGLEQNLAHHELRVFEDRGGDEFVRYGWDGRIVLGNAGGSHHFAAARFLAGKLHRRILLQGPLYEYRLDESALRELLASWALFAIDNVTASALRPELFRYQANVHVGTLPRPYDGKFLMLRRHCRRTEKVITAMRRAQVFDLGQHLCAASTPLR